MGQRYTATYQTTGHLKVFVDVPDEVIERFSYEGQIDIFGVEEWVAEQSHRIAEEHIQTWGIHRPVLLDMSLDGIGADEIEEDRG